MFCDTKLLRLTTFVFFLQGWTNKQHASREKKQDASLSSSRQNHEHGPVTKEIKMAEASLKASSSHSLLRLLLCPKEN